MRKYLLQLGALLLVAGSLTVSAPALQAAVQTSPPTPASSAVDLPWIHDQPSQLPFSNAPLLMDEPAPTCACFTLCVIGDHCCPVVVNGQCTNECIPNAQRCPK